MSRNAWFSATRITNHSMFFSGFFYRHFIDTPMRQQNRRTVNMSSLFGSSRADTASDDPCLTCTTPCDAHFRYPDTLLSRIDQSPVINSFNPASRHVLLVTGKNDWSKNVEDEPGDVVATLDRAAQALPSSSGHTRMMITATNGPQHHVDAEPLFVNAPSSAAATSTASSFSSPSLTAAAVTAAAASSVEVLPLPEGTIEVWSFPEACRYAVTDVVQLPHLVQCIASDSVASDTTEIAPPPGASWPSIPRTRFGHGQTFIFVCTHKRRNNNCGIAGPILMDQFRETLQQRNITNVHVFSTSHIGGHRFAGTIIMYPGGDCYGRVLPCHVDAIIDQHILGGRVLTSLWRGRLGLPGDVATAPISTLSW
jgi:(2Fe-2S) ferredoxin